MTELLTKHFGDCSTNGGSTPPPPSIPLDEFIADLVESGLSEDEATAFLETLTPLMWHFVNLGFEGDIFELLLPPAETDAVESACTKPTEQDEPAGKEPITQ